MLAAIVIEMEEKYGRNSNEYKAAYQAYILRYALWKTLNKQSYGRR